MERRELTHSITFYYWVDQQSGDYLNNRAGWILQKREWIFKAHGFYLAGSPQRYSVWTFTPEKSLKNSQNEVGKELKIGYTNDSSNETIWGKRE